MIASRETTPWRRHPYRLNFYAKESELLAVSIALTREQADVLGKALVQEADDGFGEYPLSPDGFVTMERGD
jgi:hypothetical protein